MLSLYICFKGKDKTAAWEEETDGAAETRKTTKDGENKGKRSFDE